MWWNVEKHSFFFVQELPAPPGSPGRTAITGDSFKHVRNYDISKQTINQYNHGTQK